MRSTGAERQIKVLDEPRSLALLRELRRGVEKEGLRVDKGLNLAQTPHPRRLGSALTHPQITTDYAEAMLEIVTPVSTSIEETLAHLDQIHQEVHSALGDEVLWCASMPAEVGSDDAIPVAQYGTSNLGRMKSVYRIGLGHRYGRRMQTIAGIHYNFSLPDPLWSALGCPDQDAVNAAYFAMIRNYQRMHWLLVYLFGASPAVNRSFAGERHTGLQSLDATSLYRPYATSLRMGDLGYQSDAQQSLSIPYSDLDAYVEALKKAILEPYPPYERIGLGRSPDFRQLSTGLLQLESEHYSSIRPRRTAARGKSALAALAGGGVEYVEARSLDVNPFLPVGIDAEQMRFMDAFLLVCLLTQSPDSPDDEVNVSRRNLQRVANEGRKPGLMLERDGALVSLQVWATELLDQAACVAALLDKAHQSTLYVQSVAVQRDKVTDSALTPSARVLRELQAGNDTWGQFVMEQSISHSRYLKSRPYDAELMHLASELAERSLSEQAEMERQDGISFEAYLVEYYKQYSGL